MRRDTRFTAGRLAGLFVVGGVALVASASPAFADGGSARGTPVSDLIPSVVVAIGLTIAVVIAARAYRGGRLSALGRVAERCGATLEMAPWAALPTAVGAASLVTAAFGFYWDVSWHIDRGREPGPVANPAHWFIIVGLGGVALAGVLAVVLGGTEATRTSVRFTDRWHPPVGGVLLGICGLIALAGFPLDDIWHRIFGQDVTLWGPTHIQMVGGASLATLALWALTVEGRRAVARPGAPSLGSRIIDLTCGGALLLGLSTLQGEFDYGVPQFRLLYQPVLIMLAGGIALVAARLRSGRGGALGAAAFFIAVRASLTVLIGPVLGRSTLHFPLYLVEALLVEAVALVVDTDRQIEFGAIAGVAIGTVGLAAEWLWSHLWMPLPWHRGLFPLAAILGLAAATAGGVLGGLVGRALTPRSAERPEVPRLALGAWAVAFACLAIPLPMSTATNVSADVVLRPVEAGSGRHVLVSLKTHPALAGAHADWFTVTAWQGERNGQGGLVIAPLHLGPDGSYESATPIPVSGTWKALVRLHRGSALSTLPLYLPADPAIPAPGVDATPTMTRSFQRDKKVLQREAVGGSPALQRVAYAVLGLLAALWIASRAWGLRRLEGGHRRRPWLPAGPPPVPA
ncbi:MAG: hypothetical protein NVSMB12_15510 [Acidimicrobiales bacterium]